MHSKNSESLGTAHLRYENCGKPLEFRSICARKGVLELSCQIFVQRCRRRLMNAFNWSTSKCSFFIPIASHKSNSFFSSDRAGRGRLGSESLHAGVVKMIFTSGD